MTERGPAPPLSAAEQAIVDRFEAAPSAVAPDDADLRADEYETHRDVFHNGHTCPFDTTRECFERTASALAAALAGERAAREALARVEALCDEGPGSPLDPVHGYVSLRRLRAALSPTPPDDAETRANRREALNEMGAVDNDLGDF